MADDTRLAEACLLLNYSSQSYKEQMSAMKQSQQLVIVKTENGAMSANEKSTSSEIITPPPESELTAVNPQQEIGAFSDIDCSNFPEPEVNLIVDSSPCLSSTNGVVMSNYMNNYCDASRTPINNLLAAVNCALPAIKNRRPTILQRPSSAHIVSSRSHNLSSTCMPDHEYCLQDQVQPSLNNSGVSSEMNDQDPPVNSDVPSYKPVIMLPILEKEVNHSNTNVNNHHSKRKDKHPDSLKSFSVARKPLKLVAVHLGAGNSRNDTESLQIAKKICEELMLQKSTPDLISNCSKRKRKTSSSNPSNLDNTAHHGECRHDLHVVDTQMTAEMAVVQLIRRMEDHQALNCGYGSNLNIMGQAECDASLMSDRVQMWAGVGALSGCRNPILLAKALFDHRTIPRPLGLVQPNLLVGSGAKQWMREHCPHLSVTDCKLVSSKSFSVYQKLKSRYDAAIRSMNRKGTGILCSKSEPAAVSSAFVNRLDERSETAPPSKEDQKCQDDMRAEQIHAHSAADAQCSSATSLDHGFYCLKTRDNLQRVPSFARAIQRMRDFEEGNNNQGFTAGNGAESDLYLNEEFRSYNLDTVGAIAVDSDNIFASAISSGGLLLKYKGRIGQAAVPGAGCWSEDSVAVTTTGVGEYLTLNLFAKKVYDKMLTLRLLFDLGHVDKKDDLSSTLSCGIDECFQELAKLPALSHVSPSERLAGMLSVSTLNSKDSPNRIDDKDLYLSFAHNTKSMCVGYMTCNDIVGHSLMSRKVDNDKLGSDGVLVRTMKFSLDPTYYVDSYFDNGSGQV